jgi:hypothetical protein
MNKSNKITALIIKSININMTINNKKSLVVAAVISALCATIASASAVTEMMSSSKANGQEILKRSETAPRKL